MSYILEALKKSEQERGQTGSPTIQTIHTSSLQYRQHKPSIWPYVLTGVVLINMAVLAYFVSGMQGQETVAASAGSRPDVIAQSITKAPSAVVNQQPPVMQQAPISEPQQKTLATEPAPSTVAPVTRQRMIQSVVSKPDPVVPVYRNERNHAQQETVVANDIYELPVDMQAAIPDMTFSAHVYSSNPIQRSVVINGNFLEEGDMLTDRLRLDEITNDGVIFDLQGTRFRSSVVSGWSNN